MEHRVLARSLAPLPEESLPGFLLRLAYRLDRSPARIGVLCGLSSLQHRLPAEYLLALPPQLATTLARTTRLSLAEAQALTLVGSGLATTYTPLVTTRLDQGRNHAAARRRWAINLSSRFCPRCLAGDGSLVQSTLGGAWRLRWHLPVVFACPQHSALLSGTCPQCRNPPNRPPGTERVGLLMQRAADGLHPAQCRHPMLGTRPASARINRSCGARLDQPSEDSPVMNPDDMDRLLVLQRRIDQHLLPEASPPRSECGASDRYFFLDLIAAVQLVKFSWPLGSNLVRSAALSSLIDSHANVIVNQLDQPVGPGTRSSSPWSAPDDPAECAALLLAADELLGHDPRDDAELRDRVQSLSRAAFERIPTNMAAAFRRMEFSPVLARALARKVNGFYQAGGHRHSKLRAPSRECRFSAEHVPALMPSTWFDTHFTGLVERVGPITVWNMRHLRRAASLKLVEMAAGGTWPECAETLGTPWNTAQHSLKILKRVLAPTESWEAFDQAVDQVACALDSHTLRINYAERRHALASWRMPDADWITLCEGLSQFGCEPTSPRPPAAAALVWAKVTQGDYLHSPALSALRRSGQNTAHLVAAVNRMRTAAGRKGAVGQLLHRLDQYASRLALTCDQSQGSTLVP
ncbi:TniQ family protein [Streptomyces lunaelactis]|uniref:TniQ family protein n=1 Tax=Streptomyces lunaelactis TaxID=1535768 RepID=UPI00211D7640|nr:TniQ family protein [Streptomyces lunaelactis]